jgi:hypothetical protein
MMWIYLIHLLLDFEDGSMGRMLVAELLIVLLVFLFAYLLQSLVSRTRRPGRSLAFILRAERRLPVFCVLVETRIHRESAIAYLEALYALPDLRADRHD